VNQNGKKIKENYVKADTTREIQMLIFKNKKSQNYT
jgi:hypothetical protein